MPLTSDRDSIPNFATIPNYSDLMEKSVRMLQSLSVKVCNN